MSPSSWFAATKERDEDLLRLHSPPPCALPPDHREAFPSRGPPTLPATTPLVPSTAAHVCSILKRRLHASKVLVLLLDPPLEEDDPLSPLSPQSPPRRQWADETARQLSDPATSSRVPATGLLAHVLDTRQTVRPHPIPPLVQPLLDTPTSTAISNPFPGLPLISSPLPLPTLFLVSPPQVRVDRASDAPPRHSNREVDRHLRVTSQAVLCYPLLATDPEHGHEQLLGLIQVSRSLLLHAMCLKDAA